MADTLADVMPDDWTPHRRDDGELLGWIRPASEVVGAEDWIAVDLLGRAASDVLDWLDAEAVLDARGLSWLAEIWMLERAHDEPLRVKLVEVSPPRGADTGRVVIQTDDFGAIDVPVERFELPWPAPATLRPRRDGESGASPWG